MDKELYNIARIPIQRKHYPSPWALELTDSGEDSKVGSSSSQDERNQMIKAIDDHPLSGNDYFACIQCGRCVGSCPAAKVSDYFNMRLINRRIIDGDESLLQDDSIWECFYCQACVNLCPKDNLDSFKTIIILRDLALRENHGIHHMRVILPFMEGFLEKGVLTGEESWLDEDALEEIKIINELTGMNLKIAELKEKYAKLLK
ncbi:MAG: 4Fe-4S dicluster domain-containing protein [Candidatus Hodarchaeota archaeon]